MSESYPAGLPAPLVNPYSYTQPSHTVKNNVISGVPRFRQMTSDRPVFFSVSWNLNENQLAVFEGWFRWTLAQGSKSFTMSVATGVGYTPHECYFADGTFNRTRVGRRYQLTAQILAVELQTLSECDYLELAAVLSLPCAGYNACDFYDKFDDFANNVLPDYWENLKYATDYS